MSKYYNVVIAFEEEQENGKTKERKETYLIEDETPESAMAEAVDEFGNNGTFRVVSVTETKVRDVSTMREREANKEVKQRSRADVKAATFAPKLAVVVDGETIGFQG